MIIQKAVVWLCTSNNQLGNIMQGGILFAIATKTMKYLGRNTEQEGLRLNTNSKLYCISEWEDIVIKILMCAN